MPETIITLLCHRCKQQKPISEFSKHNSFSRGYQYWCKKCNRDGGKKGRYKYAKTEKGKITRKHTQQKYERTEKGKARYKRYNATEKGKANRRRNASKARKFHPERIAAGHAVESAINAGKLPQPKTLLCHYCPKTAQQYHHWHGYEPEYHLDVVPVCIDCHNSLRSYKQIATPVI